MPSRRGSTRRRSRSRSTAACSRWLAPAEGTRKATLYKRERVSGSFKRAINLPNDIDPSQVQASYRDGVLRVSVARRESAQPKRIAVQ